MVGSIPDGRQGLAIERRAGRIPDPIERLRFLRHATALPAPARRRGRWAWTGGFVLVVAALSLGATGRHYSELLPPAPPIHRTGPQAPNVWLVEQTASSELYSNGLTVNDSLVVANEPRSYALINRTLAAPAGPRRTLPAGIVFHNTESEQAPFEPAQNAQLRRLGRELLQFVRARRSYHFVIDRFGRVHRIVAESDAANHAGHSVWADSRWVYLDLNASFLGVAFEGLETAGQPKVNHAQVHAARLLTEMLRSKYNLAEENCVTHAQVSVNPRNMLLGWHTDWGKDFPFRAVGLADNYDRPNAGLFLFGFRYDAAYLNATCPAVWKGLALAEQQFREDAASHGLGVAQFREVLQQKYRDETGALRRSGAIEENYDESN